MRTVGTVVRGVRAPVIRQGDDLAQIVADSILTMGKAEGVEFRDRDIVAVTEAVVARAQGNYASVDAIAKDVAAKLGGVMGVYWAEPIADFLSATTAAFLFIPVYRQLSRAKQE